MLRPTLLQAVLLAATFFLAVPLHLKMHLAIANYLAELKQNYAAVSGKIDQLSSQV